MTTSYDLNPINYVEYNQSGCIVGGGSQAFMFVEIMVKNGRNILVVQDDLSLNTIEPFYVDLKDQPALARRPVMNLEFSTTKPGAWEELTIEGVPDGATILFNGPVAGQQQHTDGPVSIGWAVPGTYALTLRCWPFLDAQQTIEVQP